MDRRPQASDRGKRRRRWLAAAVIGALHLALLGLVFVRRAPPPAAGPNAVTMSLRAVPAVVVAPPAAVPITVDLAPPVVDSAEPAGPAVAPCGIAGAVAAALAADPATIAALTPLAAQPTRAIMVWDGSWSGEPAAQPIRRVVAATVAAAGPECRGEHLVGPRLLFVPVAGTTISVAVGSGLWTWQALLSEG